MNDINQQVDLFFDRFEEVMKNDGFCDYYRDGLLYRNGNETQIWNRSKYKTCILLKDPGNPYDAREFTKVNSTFGHRIAAWICGISNLFNDEDASLEEIYSKTKESRYRRTQAFQHEPLAIVNVKKIFKKSATDDRMVKRLANKYSSYIREELDIIHPNIIICGGNVVFESAVNFIFNDLQYDVFIPNVAYVYEDKLLINSRHPSRGKNSSLYNNVIDTIEQFYFK